MPLSYAIRCEKNWLQYEQEICDLKPVFCDFYRLQVTLWHQNLFSPNLTLSLSASLFLSLSSFTGVCENYRRLAKCKVNCGYTQKIQTNKMFFFAFIFIYNKSALIPPERRSRPLQVIKKSFAI